ncbi:MAG: S8 family serine peptidase [Oscillochloris sp.]|nr:S8 family serine peptidase [Oscillochloris sp.]
MSFDRGKPILRMLSVLMLISLGLIGAPRALAQGGGTRATRTAPSGLDAMLLPEPVTASAKISPALSTASGRVAVVVQLSTSPAALAANERTQGTAVKNEQDALLVRIAQIDPSAAVLGRVKLLLNAVMLELDATTLDRVAADVHVTAINPVVDFALDLSETVPYIGATPTVQGSVNGGAGVTVAVLDSGIDYTHVAFGGAGTAEAYTAAYGTSTTDQRNTTRDGLFPTAKVIEGYDFVGEAWPNGALAPDEDPIDCGGVLVSDGCDGGHGTHVADIIGGTQGVAPGVSLYAVKVCSAVGSSCSGVALIEGMEYAVDPNGDGVSDDHVDIVNMSLGSAYGDNYFDDLSLMVQNANRLGVLTVASAGNNADRPYIVGTPSSAPAALAVAQTQVPSAKTYPLVINSSADIAGTYQNTNTLDWAPIGVGFTGDVVYVGRGCTTDTYLADPLGKVALIDRGTCNVSEKVARASAAGAVGVLVGLVAPGDAVTFSNGGECPALSDVACVPSLVIIQSYATRIKNTLSGSTVNVTVSDTNAIALVGSMVGSSSRGPTTGKLIPDNPLGQQYGQLIKPEIGAPGTSVSALVGTGSATEAFGGTSGAAPMVAGAAALIKADSWAITPPHEIKARLMNTAETTIYTNPATQPGVLAPITRIGTGEVRVDRALATGAAAWELNGAGATLSFGMVDVSRSKLTLYRTVEVKNYTAKPIRYDIGATFRYEDDATNGAVTLKPSRNTLTVPGYRSRYFQVALEIDGTKLRTWTLNSGASGGDPTALNSLEYDGYLTFTDAADTNNNLHMAWHVLPRLSPDVRASGVTTKQGVKSFTLKNKGIGSGSYTALSLLGENSVTPTSQGQGSQHPNITARYFGAVTFPIATAACSSGVMAQFGVQTWQSVTHADYPMEIDVYLDIDRDGVNDYVAYTSELNASSSFAGDGRNVVYAGPVGGSMSAQYYTQHGTNSGAFILTVCGEQVGLSSADAGKLVDVHLYTFDNYFTGEEVSHIPATMSVLNERYAVADSTGATVLTSLILAAESQNTYSLYNYGVTGTSEKGVLLLNTTGGTTESLLIRAK